MSYSRRIALTVLVLLLLVAGLFCYFIYDPSEVFFPKCPFKVITGLDCSGCGSQRALHAILHGDMDTAWRMNPLLIVATPYIVLGFAAEFLGGRVKWLGWVRKNIYGKKAAWIVLAAIFCYTVLRNAL